MKKFEILLLMICLYISNLYSQLDYSFSGYIADLPVYSIYNEELADLAAIDKYQFANIMRLRLRPEIYLMSRTRINIEYEIDAFYSNQNSIPFISLTSTNRQVVNLKWTIFDQDNISVSNYIDRLYLRQGFDWGNITVGRQRIAWGVGRVWSPTDLFNPINPANFGKIEKDGADAASLTYSFANFTDINIVYNPQEKLNSSNAGFRLRTNFDQYDFALVGGYFDRSIVAGGDFAGNFFDAGLRGEGIISMNKDDPDSNYAKFVFGMDNQFTSKLYALIEYQFNGEGAANKFDYDLSGLLNGRIINLSRDYIDAGISYQLTPLITVSLTNNSNLNDGSGYVTILGTYSISDNSSATAGVLTTYGNKFTEYSYYPTSFYLQGEFFF
jgi:hypothetical protein